MEYDIFMVNLPFFLFTKAGTNEMEISVWSDRIIFLEEFPFRIINM